MNETRKGRPETLPANIKWLICRQCNKGVEYITSENDKAEASAPTTNIKAKAVDKMDFEEIITKTVYVTVEKITGEDGKTIVTKKIFSDPKRETLIETVNL